MCCIDVSFIDVNVKAARAKSHYGGLAALTLPSTESVDSDVATPGVLLQVVVGALARFSSCFLRESLVLEGVHFFFKFFYSLFHFNFVELEVHVVGLEFIFKSLCGGFCICQSLVDFAHLLFEHRFHFQQRLFNSVLDALMGFFSGEEASVLVGRLSAVNRGAAARFYVFHHGVVAQLKDLVQNIIVVIIKKSSQLALSFSS